ncbi:MAG: alpha/beta fold hydrolase [Dehalococcoidia bacterium]
MSRSLPVEFVETTDGVSIAFWSYGAGPPLVHLPTPSLVHTALVLGLDEHRAWFEGLADHRTVYFFDFRGSGQSAGDGQALNLEAALRDLHAVVRATGSASVDLYATSAASPLALEFARLEPHRVRQLVLWHPFADWERWARDRPVAGIRQLMVGDVRRWVAMMTPFFLGSNRAGVDREAFETLMTKTALDHPEAHVSFIEHSKSWRVRGPLGDIRAPTLVLVHDGIAEFPYAASREVAWGVRDGQLVSLPGDGFLPFAGDVKATLAIINEFLARGASSPPPRARVRLTTRQREVALLVARGLSNAEIGETLGISIHTVVRHLSRIYVATDVSNRTELAAWVTRNPDA